LLLQALKPSYSEASAKYKTIDPSVTLVAVDCTEHSEVCSRFKISGYPTFRMFKRSVSVAPNLRSNLNDFFDEYFSSTEEGEDANPERSTAGIVSFLKSKFPRTSETPIADPAQDRDEERLPFPLFTESAFRAVIDGESKSFILFYPENCKVWLFA
jgi:hypothetical protein